MFPSNINVMVIVLFGAGKDDPYQPGPAQPKSDFHQEGAFGVSVVVPPLILRSTPSVGGLEITGFPNYESHFFCLAAPAIYPVFPLDAFIRPSVRPFILLAFPLDEYERMMATHATNAHNPLQTGNRLEEKKSNIQEIVKIKVPSRSFSTGR